VREREKGGKLFDEHHHQQRQEQQLQYSQKDKQGA